MTAQVAPNDLADRDEQQALVLRHRALRAIYEAAMDEHAAAIMLPIEIGIDASSSAFVDSEAYRRARAAVAEMAALEAEYLRRLPRPALSCCPVCAQPLHRSFDPFGLDGLWWRSDAHPDEPQPCPHFCLLLGAVDLAAAKPAADFDVHPGPGAPFVVPRILSMPDMVAVVSEIALADGAKAYPIAYFAPRRPPVQLLTASWPRTNFVYQTQLAVQAWRRADEPPTGLAPDTRDFDLAPWIARGQLRWCAPGSDRTRLATSPTCPFVDLPGVQHAQLIAATSPRVP
jgi:hypothetical protein